MGGHYKYIGEQGPDKPCLGMDSDPERVRAETLAALAEEDDLAREIVEKGTEIPRDPHRHPSTRAAVSYRRVKKFGAVLVKRYTTVDGKYRDSREGWASDFPEIAGREVGKGLMWVID